MRALIHVLAGLGIVLTAGCNRASEQNVQVPSEVKVRFAPHGDLEWSVTCRQDRSGFLVVTFTLASRSPEEIGVPAELGIYPPPFTPPHGPPTLDGTGAAVLVNVTLPDGSVFWPALVVEARVPYAVNPEDLHWIPAGASFRPPEIRVPAEALQLKRPGLYVLLFAVEFPLHNMDLSGLGEREDRVFATFEPRYFGVPLLWQ